MPLEKRKGNIHFKIYLILMSFSWRNLNVLIIDEISMLSAEYFDELEEIVCKIRKNRAAFGGIQVVISGVYLKKKIFHLIFNAGFLSATSNI
jgi:hypothetical protein